MKTRVLLLIGSEGLVGKSINKHAQNKFKKIICVDIIDKEKKNYYYNNTYNLKNEEIFLKKIIEKEKPSFLVNCSYPKLKDWAKINFSNCSNDRFIKNYRKNLESTLILSKIFCDFLKKKKKRW